MPLELKGKYVLQPYTAAYQEPLSFTCIAHRHCIPPPYYGNTPDSGSGYFVKSIEMEEPSVLQTTPCYFCGKE